MGGGLLHFADSVDLLNAYQGIINDPFELAGEEARGVSYRIVGGITSMVCLRAILSTMARLVRKRLDFPVAAFAALLGVFFASGNGLALASAVLGSSQFLAKLDSEKTSGRNPSSTKATSTSDPALTAITKQIDAGEFIDAENAARAYLAKQPESEAARLLLALSLYKQKRNYACIDECNKIIAKNERCARAYLYTGDAWQIVRKPDRALSAYQKFIQFSPDPQPQYEALIAVLQDQKKKRAESFRSTKADDQYVNSVTQRGLWRWNHTDPITVYITSGKGVPHYRDEFDESLREALDDWTEATAGKFRFEIQAESQNPDITVTWTDDLHAPAFTSEAGNCHLQSSGTGIAHATVQLLTVDPTESAPLGREMLHNIALHELGHALGLNGHSPIEGDIMHPILKSAGLSARDVNTVLAIYAPDFKPAEAVTVDEYGRPLTAKQQAERLVIDGSNAAASGDFAKAKELLERALKLGSKDDIALTNLATSCNNLAVKNDFGSPESIRLLHEALYWKPDDDLSLKNLNVWFSNTGKDPKSFATRKEFADECMKKNDAFGAIVELRIALTLKNDATARAKLSSLERDMVLNAAK